MCMEIEQQIYFGAHSTVRPHMFWAQLKVNISGNS